MKRERTLTAGIILFASAVAGPAALTGSADARTAPASSAAKISAGKLAACYTAGHNYHASQHLELTGGTPGDTFLLNAKTIGGTKPVSILGGISRFSAKGAGRASFGPLIPPNDPDELATPGTRVALSVEQLTSGGSQFTKLGDTALTVQALTVNFSEPSTGSRVGHRVSISGTKFAHQRMYGFVTNSAGTSVLRSFYLGEGNACGFVSRKEYVAPTNFAAGNYRLYVNPGAKLNKKTGLSDTFTLTDAATATVKR